MHSLKEVINILADKLEADKNDNSFHDGSDDLYYVLSHRLQEAYMDAAAACNTTDDYVKTLMISSHAATLFLDGIIDLPSKL